MKCQMLSPLCVCVGGGGGGGRGGGQKINTVGLKGQGFSQILQDVFLAVVDLLHIKIC